MSGANIVWLPTLGRLRGLWFRPILSKVFWRVRLRFLRAFGGAASDIGKAPPRPLLFSSALLADGIPPPFVVTVRTGKKGKSRRERPRGEKNEGGVPYLSEFEGGSEPWQRPKLLCATPGSRGSPPRSGLWSRWWSSFSFGHFAESCCALLASSSAEDYYEVNHVDC